MSVVRDEYGLMRTLEHELNRWGRWHEARLDYEGYPRVCVTENFRTGDRSGLPGHKILMLDMPEHIWTVHARVVSLPDYLQETVCVNYVYTVKEIRPGTFVAWELQEKLDLLNVSRETFRKRLYRAKRRIAGLDEPCPYQVASRVIVERCN